MGIPTVHRTKKSYLKETLSSLLEHLKDDQKSDVLIIVYVGETDTSALDEVADEIVDNFGEYVESGMIEVVSPPQGYYPDFSVLKPNLGDSVTRVRWRSKQNLDYAYLMSYAEGRGNYYLQLEVKKA